MSLLATLALAAAVYAKLDFLPDRPQPHPPGRPPAQVTVVVDPGHGGAADGAPSYTGRSEKEVNLLLANDVRDALTNLGFRVVMTRTDDRDVSLNERPAVAVMNDADAFVSIHHNAPAPGQDPLKVRYTSVYAWNPLGAALSEAIAGRLGCAALHANFLVMRNPQIPSVLIEADFITHPAGERGAWDPATRRRRARQIAQGVADWLR